MYALLFLMASSDPLADSLLDGKHKDALGPGAMRFYALAFTAYALANEGAPDVRVLQAMQTPRFRAHFTGSKGNARRGESAIYAGHVLLALARSGDEGLPLALELAQSVKPGQLLPSYVQYPRRLWPADNEVALAALRAFALRHPEADEVTLAADRLSATLDGYMQDGLPFSELDPVTKKRAAPRGCALGLSIMMRALHEPEAAAALYQHFRERFWQPIGFVAGFREWEGEGTADVDSGPIVLGVGAAASAFGLGAARQIGALDDFRMLSRSATLGMWLTLNEQQRDSLLAQSILRYVDSLETRM